MVERLLDKIHIRDLLLRCVIGVNDWERRDKQDVLINITLHTDLTSACRTDSLDNSVDYRDIEDKVAATVESSSHRLVERLAEAVADICLDHPRVERVRVLVEKPGALRFARSAAIEIVRDRDGTSDAC